MKFKKGDRVFWNDPGGRVVHIFDHIRETAYKPMAVMCCGDEYCIDDVAHAPENTWMHEHPRCNP